MSDGGARVVDTSAQDLAALGVSAEQIAASGLAQQAEPDERQTLCEVLPENWDAVRVFTRCGTQWRVGAMGGAIGLDYPSLEATMRLSGVVPSAELFDQVREMEAEALRAMDEAAIAQSMQREVSQEALDGH